MKKRGKIRKGKVQTKRKVNASRKQTKTPSKKSGINAKKIFIYSLALGITGGAAYLAHGYLKRRKNNESLPGSNENDSIVINNNLPDRQAGLPASFVSSGSTQRRSGGSDGFPLKRGSSGPRVAQLQQALAILIGKDAMNANGGVDGKLGSGTANALKMAGYSEVVDAALFDKITGSNTKLQVVFNPSELASTLYRNAQSKNLPGVFSILNQFKSVADYSSVNDYYKKIGFVSKTIVTDLLDYAFKASESSKQQIRNEFLRIGLKMNDTGRWSLQGIKSYKDIITLRETIVVDPWNNRIPVRRNTILGDEVKVGNGMTWFRSIDNNILKVPTQDVKYT
jgi:hypothetical protein